MLLGEGLAFSLVWVGLKKKVMESSSTLQRGLTAWPEGSQQPIGFYSVDFLRRFFFQGPLSL